MGEAGHTLHLMIKAIHALYQVQETHSLTHIHTYTWIPHKGAHLRSRMFLLEVVPSKPTGP